MQVMCTFKESPKRKEMDSQKCETPKRMSGTKKKKDKQGTEESAESQEDEGKIEIVCYYLISAHDGSYVFAPTVVISLIAEK